MDRGPAPGRKAVWRRRWLWVCLPIGLAALGAAWLHDWPVHHFGVVEDGVLHRSAQPNEKGWKRLRDHFGIRTVINLREDRPNEPWAVLERQFCAANGIRYIKLPLRPDRLTGQEVKTIVEAVSDRQCRPVLIHCELGKSRTGIAVAAYRVVAQGWSLQAALAESQKFKKNMEPGYAACLKALAEGKGRRPPATSAVGFGAGKGYP